MQKPSRWFWAILTILTVLRLGLIGRFELSPDEAYYWTWSRHLDWAYYDQGPMLALVIRFFTWLWGTSTEWTVRFGAVLLSSLSSIVFYYWVSWTWKDRRTGLIAFLAMHASLLFSAGAILMMHDSIMMFFWISSLALFHKAMAEDWTPGWYLGAVSLGLGALAKYSMALFVPGLLLPLWLVPQWRVQWRRPHLYAAGAITLAIISPLLLWNLSHQSASFGHIASLGGANKPWSFSWAYIFEYLGGQMGVMSPLLGGFCWLAVGWAWKQWRREHSTIAVFLAASAASVLGFFLLLSVNTRIYANWPALAYPAALSLAAGWLSSFRGRDGYTAAKRWATASLALAAGLTLLVHLQVGWDLFPLPARAAQSLDRVRGWKAMAEGARQRWQSLGTGSEVFLSARRYQIAAELSFYLPGHPPVRLLTETPPVHNQYRFWDDTPALAGQDTLFICEDAWESAPLLRHFREVAELPALAVMDGGRTRRTVLFYHGTRFDPQAGPIIALAGTPAP